MSVWWITTPSSDILCTVVRNKVRNQAAELVTFGMSARGNDRLRGWSGTAVDHWVDGCLMAVCFECEGHNDIGSALR